MELTANTLGLYLSVPFCRAKCSFCNFASGVGTAEAIDRYVGLLCAEIRDVRRAAESARVSMPEIVDSIYLGGGTPSLLNPKQMQQIFKALREEFSLQADAEITLEAAPGQIADEVLEAALGCGVNRVSLGVQSFVDREAQAVGRSHTETSCGAEFARLRRVGIPNLGADLIAGLPYQSEASWEHSLEVAASSGLDHLSVYMLEVDDQSRLGREVLGGGARLHAPAVPSDDLSAAMYERACKRLPEAGYAQYEISNFAAQETRSRHNLKYWLRDAYLGFGLDAHSMLRAEDGRSLRWANAEELASYDGVPRLGSAAISSPRETFEEIVFLGLRLNDGLPLTALDGSPAGWIEDLYTTACTLEGEGLLLFTDGRMRLTSRGRMVSSEIFGELLAGALV